MDHAPKAPEPVVSDRWTAVMQSIYTVLNYLPWIWLVLFGVFVFSTALSIGHLPTYSNPDPKSMGAISLLYIPTILLMLTVISTIPAWAVMTLLTLWDKLPLKIEWADAVFYLSGLFFFGVIVMTDIGRLMTWLMD